MTVAHQSDAVEGRVIEIDPENPIGTTIPEDQNDTEADQVSRSDAEQTDVSDDADDDAEEKKARLQRRALRKKNSQLKSTKAEKSKLEQIVEEQQKQISQLLGVVGQVKTGQQVQAMQGHLGQAQAVLAAAQRAVQEAYGSGDPEAITKAQTDWYKAARQHEAVESQAQQVAEAAQQPRNGRNLEADRWKRENADWYGTNKVLTRLAKSIDSELANEGFDPMTSAHFAEMDRRLREEAGEFFEEDEQPTRKQQAMKPTVAGPSRGGNMGGKVRIPEKEYTLMIDNARKSGIDVTDPKEVKFLIGEWTARNGKG